MDSVLQDTISTLEKVRRAAAEVGVSQHATHFKEAANDHARKSIYWLCATLLAAAITVGWGIATFFIHPLGSPPNNPPTTAQVIQFSLAKLIILSSLYYALVWCARNYRAQRHNFIVNKHRQNALSTFETFVKAAQDDPETKNAVLLQATQSIFSAQPSGYIRDESESESPNKIIEILRTIGSTTPKT